MFSNSQSATNDAESDPPPARRPIRVNVSSDEMDAADKRLAELGCTPVFKREFSSWACFSFALSISGLYATIMATFNYPLVAGGAASVVWCWLIGGAGALALALSIAEISSSYPTSGGMYFTIKYLCPPSHVAVVAWIDGWLNLIGTIAGTASSEYAAAQMLLSACSIASGFKYHPTQVHIVGTMAVLCIAHGLINSMSTHWLNKISSTYAIVHISVLLAAAVALLAVDQNKHTPEYVFTHLEPQSGWTPPAFSFWFGCLSVAWTIANCDGVGHIAEETQNPSQVIPWAITAAALFTYGVGFLYNVVLAFCMGDPKQLINSPSGMPISQIFYNVMGPAPATLFSMAGFVVMNFACIPSIHAGSRTVWAFARDEMLPLSRIWFRLNPRTDTPLPAVWLYVTLCVCVNLIGLGSHVLITAIFNVCAVALNWSYCIPILCKLFFPERFERGPWHMGRASVVINVLAVGWNAFLSVIFMLPTRLPVTADNMNYASVVLVATFAFSIIYWFAGGRNYYTGPRTRAQLSGDQIVAEEYVAVDDTEKAPISDASDSDTSLVEEQQYAVYDSGADSSGLGSSTTVCGEETYEKDKGLYTPFDTPSTGSEVTIQWEGADAADVSDAHERDPKATPTGGDETRG